MGTRGTYGFFKNGESKLTYNQFDSYPEGLGTNIVEFIKSSSLEELNQIFDNLILVDGYSKPTEEQIKECYKWYDQRVSNNTPYEWYCLIRKAQDGFDAYKHGLKYMIDNKKFIEDSLFCEYGYIINLDENVLEIYEGFQKKPNDNRYSCEPNNGYYNCKLINKFPLFNIPDNWIEMIYDSQEED